MALVNPNIAMSFRQPEFRPRNALAEYAQIQQIQGGQRQAEVADMQLRRMRQEDEDIERIHQIAMKNGGPDSRMEMGRALFASRNPTQRELGYKILQHEEAKTAFKAAEAQFGYAPGAAAAAAPAMPSSAPGAMAAPAMPSSVPGAMAAPSTPAEPETGIDSYGKPYEAARPNAIAPPAGVMRGIAPGGGMGAEMPLAPANALAPPAAAPVNAMLASAAPLAPAAATPTKGKTLEQLQREYMAYSSLEKLGAPGAAGRLKIIEQQMEDARKAFEVKGRLITRDGTVLYESPADPTNIAILEREVAALLKGGALPTDPRIAVRQSAIAQAAGQNTELMRNYSAAKAQGFRGTIFDYERQIKEAGRAPRPEPALRTQQVTMSDGTLGVVNMDTGVITPSTMGGAPVKGKPSAFAEKAAAQKAQLSRDLNFAITQLGDITKDGGLIDQSTGSGAGRLIDLGAGFVGQATEGAIAIGKIAPIADLVLKMVPRFEGPQSNKDTQSYKEAAGQLADPTLPTKIRKEAGKTVLRLMQERQGQFVTSDMATEGAAPAAPAAAPPLPPGFKPDKK